MNKPDTLDNYLRSVVEELLDCDYDRDEIRSMIDETVNDVLKEFEI